MGRVRDLDAQVSVFPPGGFITKLKRPTFTGVKPPFLSFGEDTITSKGFFHTVGVCTLISPVNVISPDTTITRK